MKKRTMTFVIVAVALVTLAAASIALAKTLSFDKITGTSYSLIEDWGNTEIRTTIVLKVNPLTQAPNGKITVKITDPLQEGVRYYETTPVCMNFGEDEDGTPWAIVVHRITDEGVSGFGPGLPLEYAKWKILDIKEPSDQSDAIYLAYECYDPDWGTTCDTDGDTVPDAAYDEFWPADNPPPDCNDTDFIDFPLELDTGNLVIH